MSLIISTYHQVFLKVRLLEPLSTHLGPLLFLVFINDLPRVFKNSIKLLLFADDAKLFCSIQSISDSETLQDQLNTFYNWSMNNCLELNIDKCNIISFTRSKNPLYLTTNLIISN